MRVLVVDDDEDVRDALVGILAEEGFSVEAACDGREALTTLVQPLPDVILLDWMMPTMDGIEFRGTLLKDPELARVPVVFLTADPRLTARSGELKANVLCKPVKVHALVAALRGAVELAPDRKVDPTLGARVHRASDDADASPSVSVPSGHASE